jgi:large conductance mechanosensitive channel
MKGFIEFLREKVVVGFAVGFIMGGAVGKLVSALVADIINPLLGLILSRTKNLDAMYFQIASAKIKWGHFLSVLIDFTILSFVVYLLIRAINILKVDDKLKKK